ncbi:hypothetical protein BCD67_03915 [Oscillatoriales cyanobacterium USR001]|nr:hypothetical protein BCD67_03915 [Oscillatoriales cyanobacterium USR001]
MSAEQLEIVKSEYAAGKAVFERGQYGDAVRHFEAASALVDRGSRFGGEVQMWLVTALDAAGQLQSAIALCKQLVRHPSIDTREQARGLLYILEAPKLSKRPEWLVEIPDLGALGDNQSSLKLGAGVVLKQSPPPSKWAIAEPVDLSKVNARDNSFVWVGLMGIGVAIAGLIFWH